jgi:hypothetical protein
MSGATFAVQDVVHITGRTQTFVLGKITDGVVRVGMRAQLSLPDGAFLSAVVHDIGLVRDASRRSDVSLALDTPEEEVRARWKGLCQSGATLAIDDEEKGSTRLLPTTAAVTPRAPSSTRRASRGRGSS